MKLFFSFFFIFILAFTFVNAQKSTPQKSLNQYITFLNQSTDIVINRFEMIRNYQAGIVSYRKRPGALPRLSSSGPLETFYYENALKAADLTSSEKQQLNTGAKTIWNLLAELDQTSKALETYVRLKTFQEDNLKQSDVYVNDLKLIFRKFSKEKAIFYGQIRQIYNKYQPYQPGDPYLKTGKQMEQLLVIQRQLLDSLPYYLNEDGPSDWPAEKILVNILTDEKLISDFEKSDLKLAYPASDAVKSFKSALQSIQTLKRQAIDDNNYDARQSSLHGNKFYLSFINTYNHDLLASYQAFVNYSQPNQQLLDFPSLSPVFEIINAANKTQEKRQTSPFNDKPYITFNIKKAGTPLNTATLTTLNHYVEFINESLRQMHLLQMLVRNYQSAAEYYRDRSGSAKRAPLNYSHQDFKIPVSQYQMLQNSGTTIDPSYRTSVSEQAATLYDILQEMDLLSIELISYTKEKVYLQDRLARSDAIMKRYLDLFDTFNQKKELLYHDIRRIFESYPSSNPSSSWIISGNALIEILDKDKAMLFAVKDYLKGETRQTPGGGDIEVNARQLIEKEYQNMNGLKRYGRNNGLCPYSLYEDLAANSLRFSEKSQGVKKAQTSFSTNPYESFYYFYNNELVYQYNKFVELANGGLLKVVNQPDVFAFRALTKQKSDQNMAEDYKPQERKSYFTANDNIAADGKKVATFRKTEENIPVVKEKHDTVYVDRIRVDTVYMDRTGRTENPRSLAGFAPNNMVLLLDVSASMDSPLKLPLLKRSIKSLLTLLRPEDQISIVLYSGKARVVLKPTSGSKSAEIARMIDLLQSTGETDGNEGLRLAYKLINKEYLRGGNNRIVLATDGEFPVSNEVMKMIGENARQDIYLSIFTFGKNARTGQKLKKLSESGQGSYSHVTEESADLQLILEAQAKRLP